MSKPRASKRCRLGEWKRRIVELDVRTGLKPHIDLVRCVTLNKLPGPQFGHLCNEKIGLWSESKTFPYLIHWDFAQSFYPEDGSVAKEAWWLSISSPEPCLLCSLRGSHFLVPSGLGQWKIPAGEARGRGRGRERERERLISCFLPALMSHVYKSSFHGVTPPPGGNTFALLSSPTY